MIRKLLCVALLGILATGGAFATPSDCEECHAKMTPNLVADLYRDGIIKYEHRPGAEYPDLLEFYDVDTKIERVLYEMFMDHSMKAFQGTFHMNPDYATWYGYAKMKKDVVEIRELAGHMRAEADNH